MQLDYSIDSPLERKKLVEQIINEEKELRPQTLEYLANYLIMAMDKEERKQKKIITDNRAVTIEKRETSFEGLVDKLENGENTLYHLERQDKNQLFQPRTPITKEDYCAIPVLRDIKQAIDTLKEKGKTARGKQAYLIKKASIELYKDLYQAKKAYKPPIMSSMKIKSSFPRKIEGVSFSDPIVIEALLCNYSALRQDSWDKMNSDLWAIMMSFDELLDAALKDNEYYETIVRMKIDGATNLQIQEELQTTLGLKPTTEYISTLWRNRIPKHIADFASNQHLLWYYTEIKKGTWKKCSCCKTYKLASPIFFSKNRSSKDGLYSICKECRNKKK